MGRPLNKKYFGNRNIGSTGTSDNGIGGEGVASVVLNALGSYTTRPVFTFSAPTLPSGVTATGTITSEALSGAITTAGTGYEVGDLLTLTSSGGSAIAYVATVDTGGEILSVNFTGTGASRGSFEALPGAKFPSTPTGGRSITTDSVEGAGAEITVTFRAKEVAITEKGSGYTAAPTAATGPTQSVSFTSVALTTDSGNVGSSTNQENAILISAYIPVAGTAGYISGTGGSSAVSGDIQKQQGGRRYKVKTAQGVGICKLVASDSPTAGQMSIIATDYNSNTYYVTKLTSHKALLTQIAGGTDYVYASGDTARWTFSAAAGTDKTAVNTTVQIANA